MLKIYKFTLDDKKYKSVIGFLDVIPKPYRRKAFIDAMTLLAERYSPPNSEDQTKKPVIDIRSIFDLKE